jgi:hypothetical protein
MTALDASLSGKHIVKAESLFVLVHALRVFTRPRGESQVYSMAALVLSVGILLVKVKKRHYSGLLSEEQSEDSSACIAIHTPTPTSSSQSLQPTQPTTGRFRSQPPPPPLPKMGFTNKSTRHHCVGKNRKITDKETGQVISPGNCRSAFTPSIPKGRYCSKHETYCPVHTDWVFMRNQTCGKCDGANANSSTETTNGGRK